MLQLKVVHLKGAVVVERPRRTSFLGLLLGIEPTILVLAAQILNQRFTKKRLIWEGVAWLNKCPLAPYWTF